jgi:hypothetical protein
VAASAPAIASYRRKKPIPKKQAPTACSAANAVVSIAEATYNSGEFGVIKPRKAHRAT